MGSDGESVSTSVLVKATEKAQGETELGRTEARKIKALARKPPAKTDLFFLPLEGSGTYRGFTEFRLCTGEHIVLDPHSATGVEAWRSGAAPSEIPAQMFSAEDDLQQGRMRFGSEADMQQQSLLSCYGSEESLQRSRFGTQENLQQQMTPLRSNTMGSMQSFEHFATILDPDEEEEVIEMDQMQEHGFQHNEDLYVKPPPAPPAELSQSTPPSSGFGRSVAGGALHTARALREAQPRQVRHPATLRPIGVEETSLSRTNSWSPRTFLSGGLPVAPSQGRPPANADNGFVRRGRGEPKTNRHAENRFRIGPLNRPVAG